MNSVQVIAPQAEVLFHISGTSSRPVHDIEFSGLRFEHTNWLTPSMSGLVSTQGLAPLNFTGAPPEEVKVSYAQNLRFTGNTFVFAGANGL